MIATTPYRTGAPRTADDAPPEATPATPAPKLHIGGDRARAILAAIRLQDPWLELAGVELTASTEGGGWLIHLTAKRGYQSVFADFGSIDALDDVRAWAASLRDRLGLSGATVGVDRNGE